MTVFNSSDCGKAASLLLPAYVAYRAAKAKQDGGVKVLASLPTCYAIYSMGDLMKKEPAIIPAVAVGSWLAASILSNQESMAEIAAAGLMTPIAATGTSLFADRAIKVMKTEKVDSLLDSIMKVLFQFPSDIRSLFVKEKVGFFETFKSWFSLSKKV